MGCSGSGFSELKTYVSNIDDGDTPTVFEGPVVGSRLLGFCKADQDLTITIYPGAKHPTTNVITYGAPTAVSITAGVTDDDGQGWDITLVAPYCKITIDNSSGSNTTELFLFFSTRDVS